MKINFLEVNGGLIAFLVVFLVAIIIVLSVIFLKRKTNLFKSKDKKPEDKEIVQEELHRVLKEVDDKESKEAMENFEKNKTQNNENKEENK